MRKDWRKINVRGLEDLLELSLATSIIAKNFFSSVFDVSCSVAFEYFPDNRMPYVDFGKGGLKEREKTLIHTWPAAKKEEVMRVIRNKKVVKK